MKQRTQIFSPSMVKDGLALQDTSSTAGAMSMSGQSRGVLLVRTSVAQRAEPWGLRVECSPREAAQGDLLAQLGPGSASIAAYLGMSGQPTSVTLYCCYCRLRLGSRLQRLQIAKALTGCSGARRSSRPAWSRTDLHCSTSQHVWTAPVSRVCSAGTCSFGSECRAPWA